LRPSGVTGWRYADFCTLNEDTSSVRTAHNLLTSRTLE